LAQESGSDQVVIQALILILLRSICTPEVDQGCHHDVMHQGIPYHLSCAGFASSF